LISVPWLPTTQHRSCSIAWSEPALRGKPRAAGYPAFPQLRLSVFTATVPVQRQPATLHYSSKQSSSVSFFFPSETRTFSELFGGTVYFYTFLHSLYSDQNSFRLSKRPKLLFHLLLQTNSGFVLPPKRSSGAFFPPCPSEAPSFFSWVLTSRLLLCRPQPLLWRSVETNPRMKVDVLFRQNIYEKKRSRPKDKLSSVALFLCALYPSCCDLLP
jgi:hypothetical protein